MPRKNNSRAAQGSGSIRQRKDGRWEARYTAGRDSGTGKQIQRSIYGDTQKEVLDKLQQVQTDIKKGVYLEPSKMTMGQWLDIWLAEYCGNLKENTAISYETQVRQHIKPALGNVKLPELTAPAVQKFYNDLQRKKRLSAKTIKNIHGVLHSSLNQAYVIRYITTNPCTGVKLPRVEKKTVTPFADENLDAFLKAIVGEPLEILFKVVVFTGLRQSEALGLTWERIDFERGTILIDRQLTKEKKKGGAYKFTPPKNNKSRLLTPAPSVMRLLRGQKRQQSEWQLQAGSVWENALGLVFTDKRGQHYAHNTLSRSFKRVAKRIGLENNCFHDLRHTYAVNALQSGDDAKTVQENLGHHTAAFTLDVYGHVTESMKKQSAERMERFIQSHKNL